VEIQSRQADELHCDAPAIVALCREAIRLLERGLDQGTTELQQDVDKVENLVAKVRDCFIERLREGRDHEHARWRALLDEVNVAVSLIAAVEYPATGVNRAHTTQALKILKRIRQKASP
jgi:hypothetical protein